MKSMLLKTGLSYAAAAALILFAGGLLWSLVPVGGHTLPHWIEATADMSFHLAAGVVSIALSLTCVSAIALSYMLQLMPCRQETASNPQQKG